MLRQFSRLFCKKLPRLPGGWWGWPAVQRQFDVMHCKEIRKQQEFALQCWRRLDASNIHDVYLDWTDHKTQWEWYDAIVKLNQMTGFPVNHVWTVDELAEPWYSLRLERQVKMSELVD